MFVAPTLCMSTMAAVALVFLFLTAISLYLWPHPEARFDKLLTAMLGAFVGSLLGRVLIDPAWPLHVLFVAGGAFAFSCLDAVRRMHRASRSEPRLDGRARR